MKMLSRIGLLALLALGRAAAEVTTVAPDDSPPAVPGHSSHGAAYDEGPRQSAYLMPGMPEIHFPVTTTNELAQQFFTQGVGQLHGFWYFEAERSFRQAAVHDPNCAMAYWGLTMANQGNTNRAVPMIRDATRLRAGASHREQLWIDDLADFRQTTPAGAKRNEKERNQEHIRALENIVFEFPEDIEAKAFLAFTIWSAAGKGLPISSAQGVESLLKEVFAAQPMHPAHHYRIHLWDGEKDPTAVRALPSAARCGQTSPGIAHLWHMPGHTFNKLKRYDDMAWQQEASQRTDHAQMIRDRVLPDQIHNYAHNAEWLIQTLNYIGRVRDALTLAKNLIELPQHPHFNAPGLTNGGTPYREGDGGSASHGRRRLMETLLRYELWDEAIALADTFYLEPTDRGLEQARRARLLGVAQFARGRTNEAHTQLAAIETAVNRLLDRVESAFEKERRFSSDLAHELRTPIAELRTACEIGGRWPDDVEQTREFFQDTGMIAIQLEKIVATMLALSRCEDGAATVQMRRICLQTLVRECWRQCAPAAEAKRLQFDDRLTPELSVECDEDKLGIIARNLVENAVAHSEPGTVVECSGGESPGGMELRLVNTAKDLERADLDHVFDRFWRKDAARSDRSHSGLGLSIARALCELLGLRLTVELREGRLFEARLVFPAPPPPKEFSVVLSKS